MAKVIKFIDENIKDQFNLQGLSVLEQIAALPEVIAPPVALPDFHYKKSLEAPSSIAVGVKGHIIPHLTSCALNCGMGVITTGFEADPSFLDRIGRVYDEFRKKRDDLRYNLTRDEMIRVLYKGPQALQQKYDISDDVIAAFEHGGSLMDYTDHNLEDCDKLIPKDLHKNPVYAGLADLGVGFAGNHFLEIQKVSDVIDSQLCSNHSVKGIGQVVLMYHGGGGIIPGFIGGYYARRMKGYFNDFRLVYNKLKYHLLRIRDFESLRLLYRYYFSTEKFVSIPENSQEGRRVIFASNASMNYGYAYRLFMFIRVRDALKAVFGREGANLSLFTDIAHNSIQKELIENEDCWVHRHNSCRISKGSLTLLPGLNNTSSYLGVGMENTRSTLNSVPHGAGDSIKAYMKSGQLKTISGSSTSIYRGQSATPDLVAHLSDDGIDPVIKRLEADHIMRPIAKLTPLASLKKYS